MGVLGGTVGRLQVGVVREVLPFVEVVGLGGLPPDRTAGSAPRQRPRRRRTPGSGPGWRRGIAGRRTRPVAAHRHPWRSFHLSLQQLDLAGRGGGPDQACCSRAGHSCRTKRIALLFTVPSPALCKAPGACSGSGCHLIGTHARLAAASVAGAAPGGARPGAEREESRAGAEEVVRNVGPRVTRAAESVLAKAR